MTDFRLDLLDRMAAIYGFEHRITITFAEMLDQWEENEWNNTILKIVVKAHEACPCFDEEN